MSRKNIYQIISEQKVDPTDAFERIKFYLFSKKYRHNSFYEITIYQFIERFIFSRMPIRESFTGLIDLIEGVGIINVKEKYVRDFDDVFAISEIILCAINSSPKDYFGKGGEPCSLSVGQAFWKPSYSLLVFRSPSPNSPKS